MEEANIDFLLMLNTSMDVTYTIIDEHADEVKDMSNYIEERDQFAQTYKITFQEEKQYKTRYFHIIWYGSLEAKHRQKLFKEIAKTEKKLKELIDRKTRITQKEVDKYSKYFKLRCKPVGEVTKLKKTVQVFTVESIVEKKTGIINLLLKRCGFFILVTSKDISKLEALEAYSKRGCVETLFSTLKSKLGMDKFGTSTDESMNAKSLMWFIASILMSVLIDKTKSLRKKDRKSIQYLEYLIY